MTLMSSISALTTSVDQLTAEVNVSKATLDAKVAQAAAEVVSAQAEQALAEGYRATTATHAADAATHLATVKAGVTYQGIAAILASKVVTAVDVFIYDTSLDSDGGAWRKRCQHTSWYNETLNTSTRGSRREFPAVAVIVAESNKVTIYDGDDPSLPMWMVFNTNGIFGGSGYVTCYALNGQLRCGTTGGWGAPHCNFIADYGYHQENASVRTLNSGGIAQRDVYAAAGSFNSGLIVNSVVNDVAMTVLPEAPIDPATGLPVPTIAVATNGGVSVIKDDGTVVDVICSNSTLSNSLWAAFVDGGLTMYLGSATSTSPGSYVYRFNSIPSVDTTITLNTKNVSAGVAPDAFYSFHTLDTYFDICLAGSDALYGASSKFAGWAYKSRTAGFGRLAEDPVDPTNGMVAITTSTYNTGWMNGDIKGAFLSSTDATSLVGSGELVTNGTFDTDTSGWTAVSGGSLSVVGGALRVTEALIDGATGRAFQVIPTVVGKLYLLSVDLIATSHAFDVAVNINSNFGGAIAADRGRNTPGTIRLPFVATATSTYIIFGVGVDTLGSYSDYDNISVQLADEDRSVNNKGLIVNGTITREAVAAGAELVGYAFSGNGGVYMKLPTSTVNDLGTNWSILLWKKQSVASPWDFWLSMSKADGTNIHGSSFGTNTLGYYRLGNGTAYLNLPGTQAQAHYQDTNNWHMIAYVCDSSGVKVYADGKLDASTATTLDLTFPSSDYSWYVNGEPNDASNSNTIHDGRAKKLALLRMSKSALTAEQIAKIYEDERKLFQPGAQCTLYGTSDVVTALAHDPKTNLLHVGTSAGRSTFDGLVRVANTTTPVVTAISAINGLIAEQ